MAHNTASNRWIDGARRGLAAMGLAVGAAAVAGCPATQFFDEGPGQPTDQASGIAPAGSIAACRVPFTKRPPVVSPTLWEHLKRCQARTPRRYLRIGYGDVRVAGETEADRRMAAIIEALKQGASEKDGGVRMLSMLRAVQRQALGEPELSTRVERSSARTFACDYTYLLNTADKEHKRLYPDTCPAYAFDPQARQDTCLFDTTLPEAVWLTSGWSCMAFTDTVGEGGSCYRVCAYDDYCAAQVGCAAPDFDLVLCALGVCTPEKVAGIY